MAIRAAVPHGAGNAFAADSRAVCFDVAEEFGAAAYSDYHDKDFLSRIPEIGGRPVTGVILCGSGPEEINKGLQLLKNVGMLVNLNAYFGGPRFRSIRRSGLWLRRQSYQRHRLPQKKA